MILQTSFECWLLVNGNKKTRYSDKRVRTVKLALISRNECYLCSRFVANMYNKQINFKENEKDLLYNGYCSLIIS